MPTAVEYVMTIDGITTDPISTPFESYSFGAITNIGPQSSGASVAKVTFRPFLITRKVDKASPNLLKACVTGQHIKKVTLEVRPTVQKVTVKAGFLIIVLQDVLISNISEAGNVHGGLVPLEEVGFNFGSFQMTVDGVTFEHNLELEKII